MSTFLSVSHLSDYVCGKWIKRKKNTNIISCLFTWLQAIKLVFILRLFSIIFLFLIRLSCIYPPPAFLFLSIKKISVFPVFFSLILVLSPSSVYAKDDIIIIILPRERTRENHFRIGKEFFSPLLFQFSFVLLYLTIKQTGKKVSKYAYINHIYSRISLIAYVIFLW